MLRACDHHVLSIHTQSVVPSSRGKAQGVKGGVSGDGGGQLPGHISTLLCNRSAYENEMDR